MLKGKEVKLRVRQISCYPRHVRDSLFFQKVCISKVINCSSPAKRSIDIMKSQKTNIENDLKQTKDLTVKLGFHGSQKGQVVEAKEEAFRSSWRGSWSGPTGS